MSINVNETVTVIVRGGGVENVRVDNLRQPDWYTKPYYWGSLGPRFIPHYRRPLFKDNMLAHGVEVVRVYGDDFESDESGSEMDESDDGSVQLDYGRPDYIFEDWLA